jgi:hypothetical protein
MMFGDTAYLESLYNNRAAIPNFQDYVDRWTNNSSGICRSLKDQCERDLPYGDDLLETMDVYTPSAPQVPCLCLFMVVIGDLLIKVSTHL